MIGAQALPLRFRREFRYHGILWAVIAVAAYLLAYSLAVTDTGTDFGDWPRQWELPIQEPIDDAFDWIGDTFAWFFNPVSDVIDAGIAGIDTFLLWLPWPVVVAAVAMIGLRLGGKISGAFLWRGHSIHRIQRLLGLGDNHTERGRSFGDPRRRNWSADRHSRGLQQSLRVCRPSDSRHHAGPAGIRVPHSLP